MASQDTGSFWSIATDKTVVLRAARIALIVGTVLAFINHWERLIGGTVDGPTFLKIVLTFFVPYSVSTYSSVQAVREKMQKI